MDVKKILMDGDIIDEASLTVSTLDRGYLFGDGVFEVTPFYNGKAFALKKHMENLFASCIKVKIPAVYTVDELMEFTEQLITAVGGGDGEVYAHITRGVGDYDLEFPEMCIPQLIMGVREVDRPQLQKLRETGVNLVTVPDLRGELCSVNTLGRVQEILGRHKAKVAKAWDALFVLPDGKITEATEAALMLVKDGMLWTYPDDGHLHKNITRELIKEQLAEKLDMQVIEKAFTVDFAVKAEEAFLCGERCELIPVYKIDRKYVADKKVGPVTKKLQAAYEQLVEEVCGKK